ncbi:MAG: hypothetical protein KF914_21605 [Rhizobiaceae bacterium]|nr:hypothetical protein [Rhizobiaceae bacterium]
MALRIPGSTDLAARGRTGLEVLDVEIVAEMASSLGGAGRKVEEVMARLNAWTPADGERAPLVKAAAEAVYAYFIQRELCGLRRHDDVIREQRIPREVLVRLGAK